MLIKDRAICIRAVDYSETSQIVTFFTRATGKISAIAKGSKRPKSAFDGPIEVFSHGKIVFSDSRKEKLAILTEFDSAHGEAGFTHLANNLFVLNCASFAAELVDKLTNEYDPHPKLFDSLLQFLQNVHEQPGTSDQQGDTLYASRDTLYASRDTLRLLILFQLALLKEVGLQPILNACVNCKTRYEIRDTKYEIYFSSSANGLICRDCEDSFPDRIRLTKSAATCLINLKLIAQADEKTLNEIEKVLVHHFTEILGRPPKMGKYILKN